MSILGDDELCLGFRVLCVSCLGGREQDLDQISVRVLGKSL